MANQKISELSPLSSEDLDSSADVLVVVDTSAGSTKKMTVGDLTSSHTHTVSDLTDVTATAAELNYSDGVTSAIQTQIDTKQATVTAGDGLSFTGATLNAEVTQTELDAKQATITGAATTIDTEDLTASRAVVSNSSGKVAVSSVTDTELGYVSGVTSAIQTQINAKQDSSSALALGTTSTTALAGDTALLQIGTTSTTALAGDTSLLQIGTTSSTALAGDTSLLALGTTSSTALAGDTTTITGDQATKIAANALKVTNATHTGEVTGDGALTIADDVVDEANLKVDNSPTNDYVLTAKSSAAGGLTWAAAGGGSGDITSVVAGTGLTGGATSGDATLNVDVGIADDKVVQIDAADVADDDFARFTANGLEGRSAAEVLSDIGASASGHTHSYQPVDAELTALAGLTSAADKGIQFTGSETAATFDLTTAGKALLDDADASAQRTTLGLAIGSDVQAYDATIVVDADIGTSVQGYDADTAKTDTAQAWTLPQRTALETDNDGSFDLSAKQNFFCTPGVAKTLTFTNPQDGQSGYVKLVNAGAYAHTAHGNTKIHADDLTAIGAAGTFLLGYLSDGTNTWVTVSKALA